MNELGERIRELRVAAGLSQRELAERVNVGFPYISKVEAGKERPSDDLLTQIAPHIGITPDDLLIVAKRLPEEPAADLLRIVSESGEKREMATMLLRKWASGEIDDKKLRNIIKEK